MSSKSPVHMHWTLSCCTGHSTARSYCCAVLPHAPISQTVHIHVQWPSWGGHQACWKWYYDHSWHTQQRTRNDAHNWSHCSGADPGFSEGEAYMEYFLVRLSGARSARCFCARIVHSVPEGSENFFKLRPYRSASEAVGGHNKHVKFIEAGQ